MKLLHINVTCSSGSTGGIIQDINKCLRNEDPSCEAYVAYSVGENRKGCFKYITSLEFFMIRAFRKLFGKTLLGTGIPTRRLIRYIKKIKPDIIHMHTIHHQALHYKKLFRFLATYKGQVVYTLHDCWPFTGGCYHYSEVGCDPNSCLHKACVQGSAELDCRKKAKNKSYEAKRELLNAIPNLTFTAVSNWLAGEAKDSYLREKPVVTVHNGIDVHTFKPMTVEKNQRFTVISVASHWTPRKHLDILLEMADMLPEMDFVVVGSVKRTVEPRDNVHFVGSTASRQQLSELYNKAHVFANFSTEETFGLVTAEAMACGLPVVAFNKTACAEIVEQGCGFAAADQNAFKEALCTLKNSDLNVFSAKCRSVVEEKYSKENMAQKYYELYCGLLKQ